MHPSNLTIFSLKVLLVSLVVWGGAYWMSRRLPRPFVTSTSLHADPIQTPTATLPFSISKNGHQYQIEPVFDYELRGVIVADHDSSGWMDAGTHESWNDYINTKDICVIWGENAISEHLSKLNFTHGVWTCYVNTSDSLAWHKFNGKQFSNNHIIPANAKIEKMIANSQIGDEIYIKGHLVNYRVDGGPPRTTSTTRDDTENGACEIIYADDFQWLARHNRSWMLLSQAGKYLSFLSFGLLIFSMALPLIKPSSSSES